MTTESPTPFEATWQEAADLQRAKQRIWRTYEKVSRGVFRHDNELAAECGREIARAKALLPHGQWTPWARDNLPMSLRSAQLYMRVAKYVDDAVAARGLVELIGAVNRAGRTNTPNRTMVERQRRLNTPPGAPETSP